VLKFHFITQQFLLVGLQGLILSPGAGNPPYATDTHIILVFESCAIIESLANQAFILSKKDERIAKNTFLKDNNSLFT